MEFIKSTGLQELLSQKTSFNNEEQELLRSKIFRIENDVTYTFQVLTPISEIISLHEHPYVPANFIRKDGTIKVSAANFICQKGTSEGCRICDMKQAINEEGAVVDIRRRTIVFFPVLLHEKSITKNGKPNKEKVNEVGLFVIPAGKNNGNITNIYNVEQEGLDVTGVKFKMLRTGKGINTNYQITTELSSIGSKLEIPEGTEKLDVLKIIEFSGYWKSNADLGQNYFKIRSLAEMNPASTGSNTSIKEAESSDDNYNDFLKQIDSDDDLNDK